MSVAIPNATTDYLTGHPGCRCKAKIADFHFESVSSTVTAYRILNENDEILSEIAK